MNKIILLVLMAIFFVSPALSQESNKIPDLNWFRFKTNEFEILSINENQGKYIKQNIQFIKSWIFERWQLKEPNLSQRCQIIVVPDNDMFKDFFKKKPNQFESISDKNGQKYVLWLALVEGGNWYNSDLPEMLTYVCLYDFQKQNNTHIPYSLVKGMALLNRNINDIRHDLSKLKVVFDKDTPCFWLKDGFLKVTLKQLKSDKFGEATNIFGPQCEALCLLLRKEFGASKFAQFIESGGSQGKLLSIYGFKNLEEFDVSYKKFMKDLSTDIKNNKTPNEYLTW